MRKVFLITLLVSAVLGLSATAVYAGPPPVPVSQPGCNPDVMDVLTKQAQAARVRNRAYEMELLYRNESVLGLTCLDQALRLSARLGYIFSDNVPAAPPWQNTVVFTDPPNPLAYSGWGAQQMLAKSLHNVINSTSSPPGPSMYNVYMSNFPPPLPPYLSPNALAALWALLNPIIGNVTGTWSISGYQWNVDRPLAAQIEKITATINDKISDLSTVPRLQLPAAYQALRDLIKQRQIWLDELEKGRKDNVGPRLDDLRDIVKGSDTKMDKDCITALDDFWKEGNPKPPGSGFPPTEGTDYFLGTPYISLKDFLQGPPIPGASPVFLDNIRAATAPENNAIIQAAYADLLDIENFSGAMVNVWQPSPPLVYNPRKTPRVLTTTWRVWDIIKAM